MLSKDLIQQPRTPTELRAFVDGIHDDVAAVPDELLKGMKKQGLYKVFLDEIVPLSRFALARYSDEFRVQPVLGKQAYDALVLNRDGVTIARLEMTYPHDGSAKARDSRLVINRGFGVLRAYDPGEEVRAMACFIVDAAQKKSLKDYSDCTLVFALKTQPPFDSFLSAHSAQIDWIVEELRHIPFQAKAVFLLVMPDRVIRILGEVADPQTHWQFRDELV